MKFENLTVAQLETWAKLYHPVDVFEIIIGDMTKWLDKKRNVPSISKKKDWQRFICNWLKKEQIKEVGL
jgi:hypothetical protein